MPVIQPLQLHNNPRSGSDCCRSSITGCYSGTAGVSYQWQISRDGGNTYLDLQNNAIYQDVQTPSLIVDAADSLNAFLFRMKLSASGCVRYSNVARITFKNHSSGDWMAPYKAHPIPITLFLAGWKSFDVCERSFWKS
ncbi:MAG: hypothetical protein HWD58_09980 [Bacteroidota bacterium]|nr:MAG: hypothetical protein HWD58_09980 [Bacteroidota bacterium]